MPTMKHVGNESEAGCPTLAASLFLRLGWVFIAAAFLAGCKPVGPNYNRPGYQAPPAYKEAGATTVIVPPPNPAGGGGWQPATPSDGMIRGKWWEIYQDPQLSQLEERIDPNNQTLRQALETYLAAHDQVKVARAALPPGTRRSGWPGRLSFPRCRLGRTSNARKCRQTVPPTHPENPPPTTI